MMVTIRLKAFRAHLILLHKDSHGTVSPQCESYLHVVFSLEPNENYSFLPKSDSEVTDTPSAPFMYSAVAVAHASMVLA